MTISEARQTTTLSLAVLRRMRFPLDATSASEPETDLAARMVLTALGIAAGALAREDVDLRSRCHLFPEEVPVWELLDRPDAAPARYEVDSDSSLQLLQEAIAGAKQTGLPWKGEIELSPHPDLMKIVRRSQELATEQREGSPG